MLKSIAFPGKVDKLYIFLMNLYIIFAYPKSGYDIMFGSGRNRRYAVNPSIYAMKEPL